MTVRAGEWRARLLLATLSLALTFVIAEIAARFLLRLPAVAPVEGTPISELSPTLGWKARADGSQRIHREDFDVTVTINSLGLRGPEIPYTAAAGQKRLAVMGDSFAQGYYANEPETLRGRLASALQGCHVDVLNGGQPGFSTDQEWLFFNEEIHKYQPTEVVLLFYYNDLVFNILPIGTANRWKPMYVESDGEGHLQLASRVDRPRREAREPGEPPEARAERIAARRATPTFHGSALWAFAASRLQKSRPDWARALADRRLAPGVPVGPPEEYLPFGPKDARERAKVEEMWKRTGELLRAFRDDVRAAGSAFSVFYVPSRFEMNDDAWKFMQRRYEPDRPWDRDAVRQHLTTLVTALDIPLIEANAQFEQAERGGTPAYLAIDGHWNGRGNEIAFDALFPVMRRVFSCGS